MRHSFFFVYREDIFELMLYISSGVGYNYNSVIPSKWVDMLN